jgi:enoyl-CoA hydratase/carnithine racemase
MNAHSIEVGAALQLALHGGVARLTLDRPPVNAINEAWLREFHRCLDELGARSDWRLLHLRSAQKSFCAGADLAEMRVRLASPEGIDSMVGIAAGMQKLFARIEALPQVTLAEIGGAALGGGLELALACDLRIAANEAKLGLPEVRLGLVPGAGGTQRLTRIAGRATALRLILAGETLDGAAAQSLGLVQWALPRADLAGRAAEIAERTAASPGEALAACKSCIGAAGDPARDGYAEELAQSRRLYASEATRALVGAFLAGTPH